MTSTQYILGWAIYLVGATGCIFSLWLIAQSWPTRLKRVLCFGLATLLYVPWWTTPEQHWLAPAFLTAIYDSLGQGPEAMKRAGMIVAAALTFSTLIALILPVKPKLDTKKKSSTQVSQGKKNNRKEPTF
ncbi:MAG: hypothetical protein PUP46_05220 [Endozoicomonas sp. (ex Botrylloides leachii)]|nr:hypothetical protein [Endozoicomonas sp. (ex Botrylloides leachii)]